MTDRAALEARVRAALDAWFPGAGGALPAPDKRAWRIRERLERWFAQPPVEEPLPRRPRWRLRDCAMVAVAAYVLLVATSDNQVVIRNKSDCDNRPSPCASADPDGTNTGVPAGTTLTPSGSINVTTNGAVINALDITGCIDINANNVTIQNTRVQGCTDNYTIEMAEGNGKTGLVVKDSTIICSDAAHVPSVNGIAWHDYTLLRVDITHCENQVVADGNPMNVVVQDSYLHDPMCFVDYPPLGSDAGEDAHIDGVQIFGGANTIRVEHNTIRGTYDEPGGIGGNSAITMGSGHSNIIITRNILSGAAWTLYCPESGHATGTSYFTLNRFSNRFVVTVGAFGPVTECGDELDFSGNTCEESHAPLTASTGSCPSPPEPAAAWVLLRPPTELSRIRLPTQPFRRQTHATTFRGGGTRLAVQRGRGHRAGDRVAG